LPEQTAHHGHRIEIGVRDKGVPGADLRVQGQKLAVRVPPGGHQRLDVAQDGILVAEHVIDMAGRHQSERDDARHGKQPRPRTSRPGGKANERGCGVHGRDGIHFAPLGQDRVYINVETSYDGFVE
jgi:hypothetical protein